MIYMDIFVNCTDEAENLERKVLEENETKAEDIFRRELWKKETRLNEEWKETAFFFCAIQPFTVEMVAFGTEREDIEKNLSVFLREFRITEENCEITMEETTLEKAGALLDNFLEAARMEHYYSRVLKQYQSNLYNEYGRSIHIGEETIRDTITEEEALSSVGFTLYSQSMVPEIKRIFKGGKKGCETVYGHPVHYQILYDPSNDKGRLDIHRILLRSLYSNHRVKNARYAYVLIPSEYEVNARGLERWTKNLKGSSLILRFEEPSIRFDEDASSSFVEDNVNVVTDIIKMNRNDVQFILEIPKRSVSLYELLTDKLNEVTMVDIVEEYARDKRAMQYLKQCAETKNIRNLRGLKQELEAGKEYTSRELSILFENWFTRQMKNSLYPQYKQCTSAAVKAVKNKTKGGLAMEELDEMIGLEEAKRVIHEAVDYFKAQRIFAEKGFPCDHPNLSLCFMGNPGTCKTSVARLVGRIFHDNGILTEGQLVEVGRSGLVGKYVGHTAQIVKDRFKEAVGGVLFIDEAYSLANENSGSFGQEAVDTIVQEMENHRKDVLVIFAGYPDKMEQFLAMNPGLRSRIAFHVLFKDYSCEELVSIAELMASKQGLSWEPEARRKLEENFETLMKSPDFGNGRMVRNIMEKTKMKMGARLLQKDPERLTSEEVCRIHPEDVYIPNTERVVSSMARIGF